MILPLARLQSYRWLIIAILLLVILRVAILPIAPPGFYVDEAASGAHAIALARHGTDARGHAWPLFAASLGGGYTTPIYLYPLAGWTILFGAGEAALRAFSLFVTLIACVFTGLAVRRLLGSTRLGMIATAVSLALPWSWLQGSLAWDPAMVPLWVALSLWMLSILLTTPNRSHYIAAAIGLPLSLIALAYVYPPCRVTAPLLFAGYYTLLLWQGRVSLRHLALVTLSCGLLVLPLAYFMFQPDALARSQVLSVFHGHGPVAGIGILALNFLSLMNPIFLFVTGDANLRHSTGLQGMLGLASIIPIGAFVWAALKYRHSWRSRLVPPAGPAQVAAIALFGIFAGYLGSALTAEGQPHSLRATAAWPFFVMLVALGWYVVVHAPRAVRRTAIALAIGGTLLYAGDLALLYPRRAVDSFDVSQRHALSVHNNLDYPELALDYYHWR